VLQSVGGFEGRSAKRLGVVPPTPRLVEARAGGSGGLEAQSWSDSRGPHLG